jgi:hypothetical protein
MMSGSCKFNVEDLEVHSKSDLIILFLLSKINYKISNHVVGQIDTPCVHVASLAPLQIGK